MCCPSIYKCFRCQRPLTSYHAWRFLRAARAVEKMIAPEQNMNTGDDRIITNLWGKKQDKKKWVVKTLKQKSCTSVVGERKDRFFFGKTSCWLWWVFGDFWILNSLGSQKKPIEKFDCCLSNLFSPSFRVCQGWIFWGMLPVQSEQWKKRPLLLMEEIPNNHLGCIKPVVNEGITYQPQLVSWISEPSTVVV